MTDEDLFTALAAPFPADRVSWRVGSVKKDGTAAMALAYIDARDVMDRFDEVCRPSGWERLHPHVDKTTTCEIRVKIPSSGEWVTKSDGAGDTAVEAEKGSLSDAFKRAAVNWGVGRYLYALPSPWVRIDQYKKILPDEMAKLERLLESGAAASAAKPANTPSLEDKAISHLKSCAIDRAVFKEAWEKNKDGWKKTLSGPAYARVVKAMQDLASVLSVVEPVTPPPADDFGLKGDDVPRFN